MAKVNVTPENFELVLFDAGEIETIVSELADRLGIPADTEIEVQVDEASMMGRVSTRLDGNKLTVEAAGGAFEDQRRARHLSRDRTERVLATRFLRAKDRLDDAFGTPPADDELNPGQSIAWDVYSEGRLARAGIPTRRQRLLYHFRIRHGFNDVADELFERLWNGENLSWTDIQSMHEQGVKNRDELATLAKA